MKNKVLFLIVGIVALAGTSLAQSGYKNSAGNVLPFSTVLRSNDVFNIGATGSPINPTNKNLRVSKLDEYLVQPTNQVGRILGVPVPGYSMDIPVGANLRSVYRPTPFTLSKLISRTPITILWMGDSVALETKGGIEAALHQIMPRNGAAFGSTVSQMLGAGLYSYNSATGGTFVDNNAEWVQPHHLMANGSVFEWQGSLSNGITANTFELYFVKVPSGVPLNVETQSFGGSWASLATVGGDSGGGLVGAATNWVFPTVANMRYRVTSTGTNIVTGGGAWNTNFYAGWRGAQWDIPGESLIDFFSSTVRSNTTREYLRVMKPDLILVTAKEDPGALADGINSLEAVLAAVSPRSDVVYVTCTPQIADDSGNATAASERSMMEIVAATNNRPVLDLFGFFNPTNRYAASGFALNQAHLSDAGSLAAGWYATRFLGLDGGSLSAVGLTNRFGGGATVDISGKANLAGGNTISDQQNFTGTVISYGSLTTTGNLSGLTFYSRDSTVQAGSFYKTGDNIFLSDSSESYNPWLIKSNVTGIMTLYSSPYFNWTAQTPGMGHPSSPYYFVGNNFSLESNRVDFAVSATPKKPGEAVFVNSNGVVYLITSGLGNTWTATNKLGP